jgi:hypothetical protein
MEIRKLNRKDEAFIRDQKLEHPRDFPKWFPRVAERLYGQQPRRPLSRRELDQLRLPRLRNREGEAVAIPPSLRAILAFDRDFVAWGDQPLFKPLFERRSKESGVVEGHRMEQVLRQAFPGMFESMPRHLPLWGPYPEMPALVEIQGAEPGQREFLYIGVPDDDGEYPLATFDIEPSLTITRASLAHLVVESMHRAGAPVEGTINFRKLTAEARNRNRRFEPKEWWDTNPQLVALMTRLGLQNLLWGQRAGLAR